MTHPVKMVHCKLGKHIETISIFGAQYTNDALGTYNTQVLLFLLLISLIATFQNTNTSKYATRRFQLTAKLKETIDTLCQCGQKTEN